MLSNTIVLASLSMALAAGSAPAQCCSGHGGHTRSGGAAHDHGGATQTSPSGNGHATNGKAQQTAAGRTDTQKDGHAVNRLCPIGKEPIDGRTFITHDGGVVGFCCPGCDEAFMNWSQERREAFIAGARSGGAQPEKPQPTRTEPKPGADDAPSMAALYPLAMCPISGEPLGSMGDPVSRIYDGREVRFCCEPCIPRFERDQEAQMGKLDARIVEMQLPYYPLETCPVAGGKLGSMGEPDNYVYQNRLVRFCCAACRGRFAEDPEKHIAAIDKAAADEQREQYPFQTCIVRGNRLGSMGDPAEVILAGRLVRLCCPPCESELRKDPAKYIAKLDEAWREAGRPGVPEPAPTSGR